MADTIECEKQIELNTDRTFITGGKKSSVERKSNKLPTKVKLTFATIETLKSNIDSNSIINKLAILNQKLASARAKAIKEAETEAENQMKELAKLQGADEVDINKLPVKDRINIAFQELNCEITELYTLLSEKKAKRSEGKKPKALIVKSKVKDVIYELTGVKKKIVKKEEKAEVKEEVKEVQTDISNNSIANAINNINDQNVTDWRSLWANSNVTVNEEEITKPYLQLCTYTC